MQAIIEATENNSKKKKMTTLKREQQRKSSLKNSGQMMHENVERKLNVYATYIDHNHIHRIKRCCTKPKKNCTRFNVQ